MVMMHKIKPLVLSVIVCAHIIAFFWSASYG